MATKRQNYGTHVYNSQTYRNVSIWRHLIDHHNRTRTDVGRRRTVDTDLPTRLYRHHGGFRYCFSVDGRQIKLNLGRDRNAAIARAVELNDLRQSELDELQGRMRAPLQEMRDLINERDDYQCVYCRSRENLVIDHFIPFAKNGATQISNLVTACAECNDRKHDAHPIAFIAEIAGVREAILDAVLGSINTPRMLSGPITPETKKNGLCK